MPKIHISHGFADTERPKAAALYWQAFGAKLGKLLGPDDRAHRFFIRTLDPAFAICARDDDGRLLGIAGYKTSAGSLTGGSIAEMRAVYGTRALLWRLPLLALLERGLEPDVLLMDGICVDADARGMGAGTALLDAILAQARTLGKTRVRLDVIDTNPRARALYERIGFLETGTASLGPLKFLFGFSSATRMEANCADAA